MEKEFVNKRKVYRTYSVDFIDLYNNAHKDYDNKFLIVDEFYCNNVLFKENNINESGESHLFSQIEKALENEPVFLRDILITIGFDSTINDPSNVSKFDELKNIFVNGIKLYINGEYVVFSDFLKSNSMSKNCQVFYINNNYRDIIFERIGLGMLDYYNDKCNTETTLSKWYAYSGLSLTDCTVILNDVGLSPENIVIVEDLEIRSAKTDSIVALSVRYLYDRLLELNKQFDDSELSTEMDKRYLDVYEENKHLQISSFDTINEIAYEFICYRKSTDYDELLKENKNDSIRLKETKQIVYDILSVADFVSESITLKEIETACLTIINKYESYVNSCDSKEIIWVKYRVNRFRSKVNMFDGEGLITKELASKINEAIGKNTNYSSFQIRLPFIKGDVHSCDFKDFFKKHNVNKIVGKTYKNQETKEYDIDKVEMILTESQFKGAKFIKNIPGIEKYDSPIKHFFDLVLNKYKYGLGIANLEPVIRNTVKLNYQVISTLPLSKETIDKLFKITKNEMDNEINDIINNLDNNDKPIYQANSEFFKLTEHYNRLRYDIRDSYQKDAKINRLSAEGCRRILCGDLLHLLYHAAGLDKEFKDELFGNKIYLPNYQFKNNDDETNPPLCVLLRNPHYSRNEIGYAYVYSKCKERNEYFSHITGAVFVNSKYLMHSRLGGADFDGDQVIVVLEEDIVKEVKEFFIDKGNDKNYPLIQIPSLDAKKSGVKYIDRMNTFKNTFSSRVGLISNMAFYDAVNVYSNTNPFQTDLDRIAMYTILSGLEIDSAKNGKKPAIKEIDYKEPSNKSAEKNFTELKQVLTKNKKNNSIDFAEKSIIAEKDKNNVFYLCSSVLEDNKLFSISSINRKKYKLKEVNTPNKEELEKAIVGLVAYEEIKSALSTSNYKFDKNANEDISKILGRVLTKKEISNGEVILEAFLTDNDNSKYNIEKYLESDYHYLMDDKKKAELLNTLFLDKKLDIKVEEIVKDFKDDGFMILFLALMNSYKMLREITTKRLLGSPDKEITSYLEEYDVDSKLVDIESINNKIIELENSVLTKVNDMLDIKKIVIKFKNRLALLNNKDEFIKFINENMDAEIGNNFINKLDNIFEFDTKTGNIKQDKIISNINKCIYKKKDKVIFDELKEYFKDVDFSNIYYLLQNDILTNNIVFDVLYKECADFIK